jgi:predicted Zn-dependent protease
MAYLNQFGREAEREADAYAVEVLPRAGYDPEGIVTFFETLLNEGKSQGPSFLSSHPATEERIENTRALIADSVGAEQSRLRRDDGGQLEIVQHRIRVLTKDDRADRPESRP